ncbi:MAG: L,D-transpeptidase [Firmicutes bacterium]|nr:L,D-transpeptidase [Bacillota bacterium]
MGRAMSHGCVRMRIPDAQELYDLVKVGTPVIIYR